MNRKTFVTIVILTGIVAISCRGGYWATTGYYKTITLDPGTMKMRVSDGVGLQPPAYRAFFRFTNARGSHEISDCEPPRGDVPHVCYNLFEVDADDHLVYRTKFLRLLSGPYGIIYGVVKYFYGAEYSRQKNSLETIPGQNDLRQVLPNISSNVEDIDKMPLSAISLVRVFEGEPEFIIVSANYSSDGHLYELHVNGTKGGESVNRDELVRCYSGKFGIATMIGDDKKTREFFGLPKTFPVSDYIARKVRPFVEPKMTIILDVVNLHFDESRVVRRDSYVPGADPTTSFLTFPQTKEDEQLRDKDRAKGFADIEYTREKAKQ